MSNTFGSCFRLTTFGESHGAAIGGIVDGCPSGLDFDEAFIASEMARRHCGKGVTPRHEPDCVQMLSGVFSGKTLGTPISFVIANREYRSEDYADFADFYRPGHADYTYQCRYGIRDYRGGGRASARETAVRVVGGAVAKMFLRSHGVNVDAKLLPREESPAVEGDSIGGIIECRATGVPAGLGSPLFAKLNASFAAAMMSIPSAVGFEMGLGFAAAKMKGSEWRDNWGEGFATTTNHCGGIQGGISNGMPIEMRVAFHAATTVSQPTVVASEKGNKIITPQGRHDRDHLPRTVVIVEAMAAMVLADSILDYNRYRIENR